VNRQPHRLLESPSYGRLRARTAMQRTAIATAQSMDLWPRTAAALAKGHRAFLQRGRWISVNDGIEARRGRPWWGVNEPDPPFVGGAPLPSVLLADLLAAKHCGLGRCILRPDIRILDIVP